MKKTLVLTLAAMLAASTCAGAQQVEITADISGNPGQGYTLAIYRENGTDGELPVYLDETKMTSDNSVKFVIDFGEKSGKYPYIVTSNSGTLQKDGVLMFTNDNELEAAINALTQAVNSDNAVSAVAGCLEEYSNVFLLEDGFEIDGEIAKLNRSKAFAKICEELKAQSKTPEGITIDSLRSVYRVQMLLCGIEYGDTSLIVDVDTNYGAMLGLDSEKVNTVYERLEKSARENAAQIEKGAYSSTEEYKAAHSAAVAIAAINASSSYLAIGEVIDELNAEAGLGFPSLSQTARAEMLSYLAGKKPFKDAAAFKAALADAKAAQGKTSQSGGSSTGGSGGGGGSYIGGSQPTLPDSSKTGLSDLESVQWAKTAIEALYEKNIVSGKGENLFAPSDYITREEFAKILVCAFNVDAADGQGFSDVDGNSWYASYVNIAAGAGIIYGISDGVFGVGMPITREDACVMLFRAMKAADGGGAEPGFSDAGDISDYAKDAVAYMANSKVINGMPDGSFLPQKSITRAEAAVIIYNLLGL